MPGLGESLNRSGFLPGPYAKMLSMAKKPGAIWELDDHTEKKHVLLSRYLSRWVPILQHGYGMTNNLVFVDGFAGPGVYAGGQPGSPVLMIKTYLNAPHRPDTVLHCFFVEQNRKRYEELERRVDGFRSEQIRIETFRGDYSEHYEDIRSTPTALGSSTRASGRRRSGDSSWGHATLRAW